MKRYVAILLIAAALVGCGGDLGTEPLPGAPEAPGGGRPGENPSSAAVARMAIADALDRIVPALSDSAAAQPLAAALIQVRDGLGTPGLADVAALAEAARVEVNRYASTIELALSVAAVAAGTP
jgi:hypothetical protein